MVIKADIDKNIKDAEQGYRFISKLGNIDGEPYTQKQLERLKRRLYETHVFDYELGELDN